MMISAEEKNMDVKGVRFLYRVVTQGLTEQVSFEPVSEGGVGGTRLDIRWKDFPGRGNSKCKVEARQYWGAPVEQRAAQCGGWGLGSGSEANQAAPHGHLGDECLFSSLRTSPL